MNEISTRKDLYQPVSTPLPFCLRSVGFNSYEAGKGTCTSVLVASFVSVMWCVSGIGEVSLYDRKYTFQPGDFFYFLPGEDHSFLAISSSCAYRWICFDGPKAADFILSYGYPRHIHAGKCPEHLFEKLAETVPLGDPFQMRMHVSIIAEILALAGMSKRRDLDSESLVKQCVLLIQTSFQDPRIDINFLCDKLGVHRATLSRRFHQAVNRTPGEYLLAVRAHHGMSLLRGTDLTVSEIARRSGVENICRFSRLIKRIAGVSPQRYRNEHRNLEHSAPQAHSRGFDDL